MCEREEQGTGPIEDYARWMADSRRQRGSIVVALIQKSLHGRPKASTRK